MKHICFKEKADLVRQLNHCLLTCCSMRLADVKREGTKNNKFFRYWALPPHWRDVALQNMTLYIMYPKEEILTYPIEQLEQELQGVDEATARFIRHYYKDKGKKARNAVGLSIDGTMLQTDPETLPMELMNVQDSLMDDLGQYINFYFCCYLKERTRRGLAPPTLSQDPPRWNRGPAMMVETQMVENITEEVGGGGTPSNSNRSWNGGQRDDHHSEEEAEGLHKNDDDEDSQSDREIQQEHQESRKSCETEDDEDTSESDDEFLGTGTTRFPRFVGRKKGDNDVAHHSNNADIIMGRSDTAIDKGEGGGRVESEDEGESDDDEDSTPMEESSFLCVTKGEFKHNKFLPNGIKTPCMVCPNSMDPNNTCCHALCSRCYKCADERWTNIGGKSTKRRRGGGPDTGSEVQTRRVEAGRSNECNHNSKEGYSPLIDFTWFIKSNWSHPQRKRSNYPEKCAMCGRSLQIPQKPRSKEKRKYMDE